MRFPASSAPGVRTGLRWRAQCGLFLCPPGTVCGNPVADGFAQGILWQTALHSPCSASRVSSLPSTLWTGLQPPHLRQESLNTSFSLLLLFLFSLLLPFPFLPFVFLSLFFSSLFFPSPSFLSFSTDHLLVSLGKPHWSRSGGCLKVGSLNTEQPPQGCLAVRLLGESCLS